ncbi:MAG: hypothetical protein Q7S69_06840 [Nitrosomonadaceae bacterium]|nr:hypothetical protein [Nitrosomonadaceae bacterium]
MTTKDKSMNATEQAVAEQTMVLPPQAARPSLMEKIDFKWVIIGLCMLVVVYLAVVPLRFLARKTGN